MTGAVTNTALNVGRHFFSMQVLGMDDGIGATTYSSAPVTGPLNAEQPVRVSLFVTLLSTETPLVKQGLFDRSSVVWHYFCELPQDRRATIQCYLITHLVLQCPGQGLVRLPRLVEVQFVD
jgi:hypothetical protein